MASSTPYFTGLPQEMLDLAFSHVNMADLRNLKRTNKQLHGVIVADERAIIRGMTQNHLARLKAEVANITMADRDLLSALLDFNARYPMHGLGIKDKAAGLEAFTYSYYVENKSRGPFNAGFKSGRLVKGSLSLLQLCYPGDASKLKSKAYPSAAQTKLPAIIATLGFHVPETDLKALRQRLQAHFEQASPQPQTRSSTSGDRDCGGRTHWLNFMDHDHLLKHVLPALTADTQVGYRVRGQQAVAAANKVGDEKELSKVEMVLLIEGLSVESKVQSMEWAMGTMRR
ncbi:hypothetical protein LTR53_011843 [Teratosphaeriaceae sp. CCFEE 6253]|nr:hypothetical protein LTR53_011843 [Teratosphaeriaceae sp. CCFEE 6253]